MFFVLQYKDSPVPTYFPHGAGPGCDDCMDCMDCIEQAQIFRADLMHDTPIVTPEMPYDKSRWTIKQIEIRLK